MLLPVAQQFRAAEPRLRARGAILRRFYKHARHQASAHRNSEPTGFASVPEKIKKVAICFDDALLWQKELAAELDIPLTFAVASKLVESDPTRYMGWQDIRNPQNQGHEIVCHAHNQFGWLATRSAPRRRREPRDA